MDAGNGHDRLDALQERIGYTFKDKALLERAMTHASFGDGRAGIANNERLEFLGDRVLGLLAAQFVFETFAVDEGGLAPRLNALVRKEACARVARRADLGAALRLSRAEERNGGREKISILGDVCEALIAALYLDGGMPAAQAFFTRFWAEETPKLSKRLRDPKTILQEWAMANGFENPRYEVTGRKGPDHRPTFTVQIRLGGFKPVAATGSSKHDAERAAAEALLDREKLSA